MNTIQFGTNKFCGPSVMSAIAGISTDEAEKIIKSVTGQRTTVTGTFERDLMKAFESLGYSTDRLKHVGRSVYSVLLFLKSQCKNGYYVITVPGHYICAEISNDQVLICDNHTKKPINGGSSVRLSQKVVSVFRVVK